VVVVVLVLVVVLVVVVPATVVVVGAMVVVVSVPWEAQFTVSESALTFVFVKAFGQVIASEFPALSVRSFVTPYATMERRRTPTTPSARLSAAKPFVLRFFLP
jgi:hypothetical protein